MSWARVDDGLWEHPKFEALRESGNHAAAALWLFALSYCGRKQTARITVREASMLLCADEAAAVSACDVLRSNGLLDDDSASKQNRSYLIHDWEHYRSKDEAKAIAGRQGGKKSGESRRSKREAEPKQQRSGGEAEPKQTRTPDPVPGTDPVPDPVPMVGVISERAALGNELRKLGAVLPLGAEDALGKYLPCTPAQVAEAVRETIERTGKPKANYALSVLASLRERGSEAPPKQAAPPAPRGDPDRATWALIGKRFRIYGLDPYEADAIRAIAPTREQLERCCDLADKQAGDGPGATWADVIALLRNEATPEAVAC